MPGDEDVGMLSIPNVASCEKSIVNRRLTKMNGTFLSVFWFLPTGKVDMVQVHSVYFYAFA